MISCLGIYLHIIQAMKKDKRMIHTKFRRVIISCRGVVLSGRAHRGFREIDITLFLKPSGEHMGFHFLILYLLGSTCIVLLMSA